MGLADVLLWKPRHHVNILVTTVAGSGVSFITTLAVAAGDAAAAAGQQVGTSEIVCIWPRSGLVCWRGDWCREDLRCSLSAAQCAQLKAVLAAFVDQFSAI